MPTSPSPSTAASSLGVEAVSEALYNSVSRHHAQIGSSVPRHELKRLENRLIDESKALYHEHKWEEAMATFAQLLAVIEKTHEDADYATRGAIVNNIGSCLHNLGEHEAARAYYQAAVEAFEKTHTPIVDRLFFGDVNRRRIDWVKSRLVDLSWGARPEEGFYLDGNGIRRKAPAARGPAPAAKLSPEWADRMSAPPTEHRPAWMQVAQDE
uniref:Uncharacterized protein n=1 Tax=Calcidiscus leptoporus TaxID=127549 RepID=A0A7S0P0H3_9EUKA|mmetsp:Transcript_44246/g.103477  ORF Transcript_44246/g.103477 Transcript_44246/m.103477 type:complete len:211 (+) Transcript_44246:82-714(+)